MLSNGCASGVLAEDVVVSGVAGSSGNRLCVCMHVFIKIFKRHCTSRSKYILSTYIEYVYITYVCLYVCMHMYINEVYLSTSWPIYVCIDVFEYMYVCVY